MAIAMVLAHLLADYVFQPNRLAYWKSQQIEGVFAHTGIVVVVTLVSAIFVAQDWTAWALMIGFGHVVIDVGNFYWTKRHPHLISPLVRYMLDQMLHFTIIFSVLIASGELVWAMTWHQIYAWVSSHTYLILVYVFVTMPCWVLIEFVSYGLVQGRGPDFSQQDDKYLGMLERILIVSFMMLGQFFVAWLVSLPRMIFEFPHTYGKPYGRLYLAKWLVNLCIGMGAGYLLMYLYR